MNKFKNIGIFFGIAFILGALALFSGVGAQGACQVTQVELSPGGNQGSTWYRDVGNNQVDVKARLDNCEGGTVAFRVWGKTSAGNLLLDEDTFSPSSALAEIDDSFIIGEDGCITTRSPQCQYYVTFNYTDSSTGASADVFTSEFRPLSSAIKDVLAFNCDGLCSALTNVTSISVTNLQSTYQLTLNTQATAGVGDGIVTGAGTYPVGSEANARAIPNAGSYFVEWLEGGSRVAVSPNIKVLLSNQNRTLTAVFASGTAPNLPSGNATSTPTNFGECTVGPVSFSPQGNLLFAYTGSSIPVQIDWLATNCYGKTLEVTFDAKNTFIPPPAPVSAETITFDDALFGFDASNPYDPNLDLAQFTTTAELGDGPCDLALFPACQYFIEIIDVSPVDAQGVLYSSRGDSLRTTGRDMVGFHCFGACDASSRVNPWQGTALQKQYELTLEVVSTPAGPIPGGVVQGGGVYPINSEVNIDARPNAGYVFSHWELEDGSQVTAQRAVVTMGSDRTLKAHFNANQNQTLTINIVGDGAVPGGAGTYPQGSVLDLIAEPNAGSRFVGWRQEVDHDDNPTTPDVFQVVGRATGLIVTLNKDIVLEAMFEEVDEVGLGNVNTGPAGGLVPCGDSSKPAVDVDGDGVPDEALHCDYNFFVLLIENVIDYIFILVVPIAAIIAVVTGILFLTSGGNPSARQKAKKAFGKFFIGLIIIMVAWLIVATVLEILGVDGAYTFLDL